MTVRDSEFELLVAIAESLVLNEVDKALELAYLWKEVKTESDLYAKPILKKSPSV
jgi:hypothetical protein